MFASPWSIGLEVSIYDSLLPHRDRLASLRWQDSKRLQPTKLSTIDWCINLFELLTLNHMVNQHFIRVPDKQMSDVYKFFLCPITIGAGASAGCSRLLVPDCKIRFRQESLVCVCTCKNNKLHRATLHTGVGRRLQGLIIKEGASQSKMNT